MTFLFFFLMFGVVAAETYVRVSEMVGWNAKHIGFFCLQKFQQPSSWTV
jgi:hypothetical protein